MEGLSIFISILAIVWSVLSVILFFKVWGMTNDVKEIKEFLVKENNQEKPAHPVRHQYKIGDMVKLKSFYGEYEITELVADGSYRCKDIKTGEEVGIIGESEIK